MEEYKLLLVGAPKVGKTKLMTKYICDNDNYIYIPTIVSSNGKQDTIAGELSTLNILDIGGSIQFNEHWLRNCAVVIIVYDITVRETFFWARDLLCYLQASSNSFSIVLVGNKTDRSEGRQVSTDEGSTLAQEHKAKFLETSADARAKDIRVVFTGQLEDNIKSTPIPNSLGRQCLQHRTSQLTLLAKPARHEPTALCKQELAQTDGVEYKGIDERRRIISTESKARHQGLHKERKLVQPGSYWSHEDESEIRDDKQGIQGTWWRRIMTCL